MENKCLPITDIIILIPTLSQPLFNKNSEIFPNPTEIFKVMSVTHQYSKKISIFFLLLGM